MGFFKNLFKKKEGGTFFGNLLRGVANKATGGILGSGVGLAKSDAEFEARRQAEAQAEYEKQQEAQYQAYKQSQAYQIGQDLGAPINNQINSLPAVQQAKSNALTQFMKDNVLVIVLSLGALIGGVVYLVKRKKR